MGVVQDFHGFHAAYGAGCRIRLGFRVLGLEGSLWWNDVLCFS